ncbi:MAG: hypothetical protein P1U49_16165 [Minwuia sp.]|nr:hypothetical protein [Minwuia sp.]
MAKLSTAGGPPASHAIEHLADVVNADQPLVHRGRFIDLQWLWQIGEVPYFISIQRGMILELVRGPVLMRSHEFAIRGAQENWERFWAPMPRPGFHDLFAMTKSGRASIDGNLQPLMANLRYFKEVLAAPRKLAEDGHHG